jgi:Ca-activated chloride channel family protein
MAGAPLGGMLGVPQQMIAEFDEKTLQEIASMTGGAYFNASSLEGFQEIYRKIEKLHETESQQPDRNLVEELYPLCVAVALAACLLGVILKATYLMRVP